MRKELVALSFSEKIQILEKLRDQEKAIAAGGPRRAASPASSKLGRTITDMGRYTPHLDQRSEEEYITTYSKVA